MKLWVITQNSEDRIAIDNYYRRTEINSAIPFSISTRIGDDEVDLGYYENVDTADFIIKMMDEHLINVYDRLSNKCFYYISDLFFKMPPLGWDKDEN